MPKGQTQVCCIQSFAADEAVAMEFVKQAP